MQKIKWNAIFSQKNLRIFALQNSSKLYNRRRCSFVVFSCLISKCLSYYARSKDFQRVWCTSLFKIYFLLSNSRVVIVQVVCKQLQRPVDTSESLNEQTNGVSMNTSFMLEIKGSVLPPWVVWRVCAAVQQLQSGNFEARWQILLFTKWKEKKETYLCVCVCECVCLRLVSVCLSQIIFDDLFRAFYLFVDFYVSH